jgi:hypothetical protein
MTHSELAALELQARIMGWEPAVTEDAVIEVPGPSIDHLSAVFAEARDEMLQAIRHLGTALDG